MRPWSVVILLGLLFGCPLAAAAKDPKAMTALEVIHARKSVRNFTGEPVSKLDLELMVKAGMAAPTAVNKQPWAFVVVTQKEQLAALAQGLPFARMLDKAGAAIIVCAAPKKAFQNSREYAVIDSSLASENVLLAAEALGLGAVWTAAYPDAKREAHVRKVLSIPGELIVLNVIPVGHPTGQDQAKDKYKKENLHWERW